MSAFAVLVMALSVSCNGGEDVAEKSVFGKMAVAYDEAALKVSAAKDISGLNEINTSLEEKIKDIETQCAEELKSVRETKAVDADAYKSDEDALKKAQKAYDDAFVEKYLNLTLQ